jgi:hypothetical protein
VAQSTQRQTKRCSQLTPSFVVCCTLHSPAHWRTCAVGFIDRLTHHAAFVKIHR